MLPITTVVKIPAAAAPAANLPAYAHFARKYSAEFLKNPATFPGLASIGISAVGATSILAICLYDTPLAQVLNYRPKPSKITLMQNYSLTILVNEKVTDADKTALFDGIKKSFTTLTREDLWGVKSLAYEIKHNSKAYYAYFEFETTPEAIITLDKNIRLNEDILRYLIVKPRKIKKLKAEKEVKVEEEKVEAIVEKGKGKKAKE